MRRVAPALCLLALALPACRSHAANARARAPRAPAIDLRAGVDARPLEQLVRTRRFSVGRPSGIRVTASGDAAFFLRAPEGSEARALHVWERATGRERVLVTAPQLLGSGEETLSPEERARRERQRILGGGVTGYDLSPDGQRALVALSGRLFVVERSTGAVRELPSEGGAPLDARFSPDGRMVSLVRGGELAVVDLATNVERRLTQGATPNLTHAVAEFVAQEELDRMEGYWWSPDSSRIVYQETDLSRVERLRISDPAHPEAPPDEPAYPRAGTPNADVRLVVVPVAGGPARPVVWDRAAYPYLATVRWSPNAPLTLVLLNRAQTDLLVLAVHDDGTTRALVREHDDAWVNVDQDFPRWSSDGRGFLWATERDGRWRIERRGAWGQDPVALTPPDMDLRGFLQWDEARGALYVRAGDREGDAQLARVTQENGAPRVETLTRARAEHGAVIARDGSLQVREAQTLDALPAFTVHGAGGDALGTIASTAEAPLVAPRVELRAVGAERFRVAVVRPRGYDPRRRYPVIAWVYGGPHAKLVARSMTRFVLQQWLADQGFVVVMADGRGTPDRGRAWERALHLRLGDVPLEDQVRALQALGAEDPSLDLGRVGVIGWSFGGYLAARAVLERPDVFHAAVAGAPVTDWREYDTCYTERYLGLVDEHADAYERASLLPRAPALRRPLLIVHGTADDNVYFHNGLRLADALLRAGRRFEFLPLAGQTHMVGEPVRAVAWVLRARAFLAENLR